MLQADAVTTALCQWQPCCKSELTLDPTYSGITHISLETTGRPALAMA